MKGFIRKHLNAIFIVGTLLLILWLGMRNNEFYNAWQALTTASVPWLLACLGAYVLHLFLDALSLHYFLRKQGHPVTLRYAMYVALVGLYYADITPGASGGQPMQIYYLKKRDVPIGVSTSALAVKYFCFVFMLLLMGGAALIWQQSYVSVQLAGIRWFLLAGFLFNAFSIMLVLLLAINKRLVRFLISLLIRLGHKLHLVKDVQKSTLKWEGTLASFHSSVSLIRSRPKEMTVLLLMNGLQVMAHMFITVCVYHAFGLSGTTLPHLVTIALLLYISAAYTPLPGGSGAQEGGFVLYFQGIFPANTIFIGMLVWRFLTFYLNLIGGASATIFGSSYELWKQRRMAERAAREKKDTPPQDPGPEDPA